MADKLAHCFESAGFMPFGQSPLLLWIDVASDLVIATVYFSIPFALCYFVRRRPDVPFHWIFPLFGAFVLACGTTHLLAVWNLWHADYWADAGIKAITAGVSTVTAILLWPLLPKAVAIPRETELERRVAERTAEFEAASKSLRTSEARFRSLTEMSSDFYWESDAEHRLTRRGAAYAKSSTVSTFERGAQIGIRRWEIPYLSPDAAGWAAHRASALRGSWGSTDLRQISGQTLCLGR